MPVTTNIFPGDTLTTSPASEAFSAGSLSMPSGPSPFVPEAVSWSEVPLNWILVSVSVFLFILVLRRLLGVFPYISGGIFRWKPLANLEDSMRLMRDRNMVAASLVLPFCLVISRYGMYEPGFAAGWPLWGKTLLVVAAFFAFMALRSLMIEILRPKKISQDTYSLANHVAYDFFILSTLAVVSLVGLAPLAGLNDLTVKTILIYFFLVFFILFLVRRTQILRNACNQFTAFLYLCGLELLPVAIVSLPAVIL